MSDLISREDLIKSIDFDVPLNQYERDTLNLVLKRIKALPTVEPQISKSELREKMLKYGFTAPDMTVTEFVEDFETL